MKFNLSRILASLISGLLVVFVFWVSGFDFNQRGFTAVMCTVCTIFTGVFIYFAPYWNDLDA